MKKKLLPKQSLEHDLTNHERQCIVEGNNRMTPGMNRKHLLLFVLLCFFTSGALGLVYEVVWTRQLRLIFGSTVQATSTVLTLFMSGMALGSYFIGRLADRKKDPLRLYAILELSVGLYAFLLPSLLSFTNAINTSITLHIAAPWNGIARFLLCGAILILPCSLMGATLPVLARLFTRVKDEIGKTSGALYALNTFGAVSGAFLTGFCFLPCLGMKQTLFIAACTNCLVGILLLLHRHSPGGNDHIGSEEIPVPSQTLTATVFLAAFAISGCTSMIYENIWTRLLGMIYGNTTYAFSSMLTVFLFGLALGSALGTRLTGRIKNLHYFFAVLQCLIGASILITFPILKVFPSCFLSLYYHYGQNWPVIASSRFVATLLVMGLPTILYGISFPILAALHIKELKNLGRSLGSVYAINTMGCVIGAFMGGFLLMPLLGCQNALVVTIFINLFTGVVLIAMTPGLDERPKMLAIGLFTIIPSLGAFLLAGIDRETLTTGVYYSAERISRELSRRKQSLDEFAAIERFLYYKDGADATVAVVKYRTQLALKVNGKTDASTGAPDMTTQILVSQLPLLLSKKAGDILVIGFGSGVTLGSALTHPIERATCVEISPEILEASTFFKDYNHNALADKRVRVFVRDARNHLQSTEERYDIIISEPSNPWLPGAAGLFTEESYLQMRKRLKPDGMVCQWMQNYNLNAPLYRSAIATFHSVFPHSMLWKRWGDTILIGSVKPFALSFSTLEAGFDKKEVKDDLRRVGIAEIRDIFSFFVLDEDGVKAFTERAPLNTDDRPILEFSSAQMLSQYFKYEIEDALKGVRKEKTVLFLDDSVTHSEGRYLLKSLSLELLDREGWMPASAGALLCSGENRRAPGKKILMPPSVHFFCELCTGRLRLRVEDGEKRDTGEEKKIPASDSGISTICGHRANWVYHNDNAEQELTLSFTCPIEKRQYQVILWPVEEKKKEESLLLLRESLRCLH